MGADGEWTYRCNRCNHWLPISDFHKDQSKIFGIAYTCKECRKGNTDTPPMLLDWEQEQGLKVLETLGYDLKKDISTQFIERVKLKYGVALT